MTAVFDMTPPAGLDKFLTGNGWGDATVHPVAGDASFRRYFRIESKIQGRAILMDAPPPQEDPRPFIDVAEYLIANGFRAPQILARDLGEGLLLLEDFGNRRMREHLDEHPDDESAIYRQAIDVIIDLAKTPCAALQPYDMSVYLREVQLLTEWYMPAMALHVDQAEFDDIWRNELAAVSRCHNVTVLRDYHAENIMLLDDGAQGLIDFQDALVGHPAYDLVSLLQDARRDVSPGLETAMLEYYRNVVSAPDDFDQYYALLGAQRNTKIIGIFTRLWMRDGKDRYLEFLPRMWTLLERDLTHPALVSLKHWFDKNIPAAVRMQSPAGLE